MNIDILINHLENPKKFFNSSEIKLLNVEQILFNNKIDELLIFSNQTQAMIDKNSFLYDIHFIKQGDKYIIEYRFFQRINGRYTGTKNIYISLADKHILKQYLIKLQNNFTFIFGKSC